MDGDADLPQIAHAIDSISTLFGVAERGKEQGGENRDDGNYDQQLDQCETGDQRLLTSSPAMNSGSGHIFYSPLTAKAHAA